jgi:2-oxoglutarate dehydrogenase E1 component
MISSPSSQQSQQLQTPTQPEQSRASTQVSMLSRRVLGRSSLLRWAKYQPRPLITRTFATPATPPSPNDPFANGTNTYYAEEMYRHWRQDPESVHVSWDAYFRGLDKGLPSSQAFQPPPRFLPVAADGAPALHAGGGAELDDHLKVIRASYPSNFDFSL